MPSVSPYQVQQALKFAVVGSGSSRPAFSIFRPVSARSVCRMGVSALTAWFPGRAPGWSARSTGTVAVH